MFLRKSSTAAAGKSDGEHTGQNTLGETAHDSPSPAPSRTRVLTAPPARPSRPGIPTIPGATAKSGIDAEPDGAKLIVGSDIRLKGEISHCDVLVIEGEVDAEHRGKYVRITEPGRLHGDCVVDVADIAGTFEGTMTIRQRLVLRPTGRVSGHIRYQEIVIEPGGSLSGDVGQMDAPESSEPSRSRQLREALSSDNEETSNSARRHSKSSDA